MAGKNPDDNDRSKSLLSKSALPKIEIPRSSERERREFKLPETLHTPIPSRSGKSPSKPKPSRRKRRTSTAKFRDRTQGWFKEGEALETPADDENTQEIYRSSFPLVALLGGAALIAAAALIWWLR